MTDKSYFCQERKIKFLFFFYADMLFSKSTLKINQISQI